tara:strand:+ start:659 stop:919 length:261 start_codon:yes stop_codon:yes gene_type:complete
MSGRIGRYTYKNTSVLKEFLTKLVQALGRKAGEAGQRRLMKQLAKDPEMKKLMKKIEKDAITLKKRQDKERKTDPEMDKVLKSFGL